MKSKMSKFTFTFTNRKTMPINEDYHLEMKQKQEEAWKGEKEKFINDHGTILNKILVHFAFMRESSLKKVPKYYMDHKKKYYSLVIDSINSYEPWINYISHLNFHDEFIPLYPCRRPLFLKDLLKRIEIGENVEEIYNDYKNFLSKSEYYMDGYKFRDYINQFPTCIEPFEFISDLRRIAYEITFKKLSETNKKFLE